MLTAVELFAGVGGFGIALEQNNFDVVAQVEIDKRARNVLREKFPNSLLLEDVRNVTGDTLKSAGFISDGGIITGGFPCQDLSVAGRRAGFDGERSVLFYEFARIIEETQTEWVILENVPGLLSSRNGRDMGAVIGTLAELGYGCAWRVLDSKKFGVPQRRRRVFVVARRFGDAAGPAKVLFERKDVRGHFASGPRTKQGVAREAESSSTLSTGKIVYGKSGYGSYTPGIKAFTSSMEKRPEDSIVVEPYVKVVRSGARNEDGSLPPEVWRQEETHPTISSFGSGEGLTVAAIVEEPVSFTTNNYLEVVGWEKSHYSSLLATPPSETTELQYDIREGMKVRRLTPLECERLQGFPDNHTLYGKNAAGEVAAQPDTARYKQMGNAVAVPVVSWIINGIKSIIEAPL